MENDNGKLVSASTSELIAWDFKSGDKLHILGTLFGQDDLIASNSAPRTLKVFETFFKECNYILQPSCIFPHKEKKQTNKSIFHLNQSFVSFPYLQTFYFILC